MPDRKEAAEDESKERSVRRSTRARSAQPSAAGVSPATPKKSTALATPKKSVTSEAAEDESKERSVRRSTRARSAQPSAAGVSPATPKKSTALATPKKSVTSEATAIEPERKSVRRSTRASSAQPISASATPKRSSSSVAKFDDASVGSPRRARRSSSVPVLLASPARLTRRSAAALAALEENVSSPRQEPLYEEQSGAVTDQVSENNTKLTSQTNKNESSQKQSPSSRIPSSKESPTTRSSLAGRADSPTQAASIIKAVREASRVTTPIMDRKSRSGTTTPTTGDPGSPSSSAGYSPNTRARSKVRTPTQQSPLSAIPSPSSQSSTSSRKFSSGSRDSTPTHSPDTRASVKSHKKCYTPPTQSPETRSPVLNRVRSTGSNRSTPTHSPIAKSLPLRDALVLAVNREENTTRDGQISSGAVSSSLSKQTGSEQSLSTEVKGVANVVTDGLEISGEKSPLPSKEAGINLSPATVEEGAVADGCRAVGTKLPSPSKKAEFNQSPIMKVKDVVVSAVADGHAASPSSSKKTEIKQSPTMNVEELEIEIADSHAASEGKSPSPSKKTEFNQSPTMKVKEVESTVADGDAASPSSSKKTEIKQSPTMNVEEVESAVASGHAASRTKTPSPSKKTEINESPTMNVKEVASEVADSHAASEGESPSPSKKTEINNSRPTKVNEVQSVVLDGQASMKESPPPSKKTEICSADPVLCKEQSESPGKYPAREGAALPENTESAVSTTLDKNSQLPREDILEMAISPTTVESSDVPPEVDVSDPDLDSSSTEEWPKTELSVILEEQWDVKEEEVIRATEIEREPEVDDTIPKKCANENTNLEETAASGGSQRGSLQFGYQKTPSDLRIDENGKDSVQQLLTDAENMATPERHETVGVTLIPTKNNRSQRVSPKQLNVEEAGGPRRSPKRKLSDNFGLVVDESELACFLGSDNTSSAENSTDEMPPRVTVLNPADDSSASLERPVIIVCDEESIDSGNASEEEEKRKIRTVKESSTSEKTKCSDVTVSDMIESVGKPTQSPLRKAESPHVTFTEVESDNFAKSRALIDDESKTTRTCSTDDQVVAESPTKPVEHEIEMERDDITGSEENLEVSLIGGTRYSTLPLESSEDEDELSEEPEAEESIDSAAEDESSHSDEELLDVSTFSPKKSGVNRMSSKVNEDEFLAAAPSPGRTCAPGKVKDLIAKLNGGEKSANGASSSAVGFVARDAPVTPAGDKRRIHFASSTASEFIVREDFDLVTNESKRSSKRKKADDCNANPPPAKVSRSASEESTNGQHRVVVSNIPEDITIAQLKSLLKQGGIAAGLESVHFVEIEGGAKVKTALASFDSMENALNAVSLSATYKIKGHKIFLLMEEGEISPTRAVQSKLKMPVSPPKKFCGIVSNLHVNTTISDITTAFENCGVKYISQVRIFRMKSHNDSVFAKIKFFKKTALLRAVVVSENIAIRGRKIVMKIKQQPTEP